MRKREKKSNLILVLESKGVYCHYSGAPKVTKFGYSCNREILVVTCSQETVRPSVRTKGIPM